MLKSSRLVAVLGCLLGISVVVLPTKTFAVVELLQVQDTVSVTVNGFLSLTVLEDQREVDTGVTTWDSTNNRYTGTFTLMDKTENFGTTAFRVYCNYISDPNPDASVRYTDDCSNGWRVTAESGTSSNGYATMEDSVHSLKIYSNSTNLNGSSATWLMKVIPVSRTLGTEFGSNTITSSAGTGYSNFNVVPVANSNVTVAEGNTFNSFNGINNGNPVYTGYEDFKVRYGFTAGMDAAAGTYTGTVTYTLHVKAS
ncbi:hypothetical protein IJH29_00355 [Candidatus Saccharibacteria bacterium]|nr:hypothetical protein [Candidatus Saccharibacteria bacterium]